MFYKGQIDSQAKEIAELNNKLIYLISQFEEVMNRLISLEVTIMNCRDTNERGEWSNQVGKKLISLEKRLKDLEDKNSEFKK
jgi:uncharacterized coiled-coil protein SlyX|tara:strand:+ start:1790 stop:2035 length:246 start_codon:yes stop_codon:yes gene_type:complete